ncbi:DUF4190 domain-containing protein [Rhodococcus sp. USK13]|uniref:DUF4190 domain-containing protein n=1 Tax=Rhodococcus sp. USK13 TaxID=2806442 RepID=UPI001BD1AB4D|nr:DUF4190 domain-containing protein [Rhodococcus sp. USK13]
MNTVDMSKTPAGPALDPINPYAVISLVAALLGLFPVAIVFGILAFWRPGGRGIAIAGLILGVLEALATAAVLYSAGTAFNSDTDSQDYSATAVTTFPEIALPAPFTAAPTTAVAEPTTVETTTVAVETTAPAAIAPVVNGDCDPSVDNHATAADGTFLKCTYAGSTRPHWVRSVPIIGTASEGDSCDPSVTGIAVSPQGQDLFCVTDTRTGGGTWTPGP